MTPVEYVIAANVAVWLGIGLYTLFLGRRAADLDRRLNQLEALRHDDE